MTIQWVDKQGIKRAGCDAILATIAQIRIDYPIPIRSLLDSAQLTGHCTGRFPALPANPNLIYGVKGFKHYLHTGCCQADIGFVGKRAGGHTG
jgi:hypothetical protein